MKKYSLLFSAMAITISALSIFKTYNEVNKSNLTKTMTEKTSMVNYSAVVKQNIPLIESKLANCRTQHSCVKTPSALNLYQHLRAKSNLVATSCPSQERALKEYQNFIDLQQYLFITFVNSKVDGEKYLAKEFKKQSDILIQELNKTCS